MQINSTNYEKTRSNTFTDFRVKPLICAYQRLLTEIALTLILMSVMGSSNQETLLKRIALSRTVQLRNLDIIADKK